MSVTDENADARSPELRFARIRVTVLSGLGLLLGFLVVGLWAHPWEFARGNPSLAGVATARAYAQVVSGCRAGDSRNLINCVQYGDFDARDVHVRRASVQVCDGYRQSDEDPQSVPILYEVAHPKVFTLARGNPGVATRVLGTAWMSIVLLVGGTILGVMLGSGLDWLSRRAMRLVQWRRS